MDLILWRHAEAEIAAPGQDDLQRALTPKGERQARRMAAWLNQRLAATTRVLVSPALRCRQTAEARAARCASCRRWRLTRPSRRPRGLGAGPRPPSPC